jgi:hypothetical protein
LNFDRDIDSISSPDEIFEIEIFYILCILDYYYVGFLVSESFKY